MNRVKADSSPTPSGAMGALDQAAGSLLRPLAAISDAPVIGRSWMRLQICRLPSGMERHGAALLRDPVLVWVQREREYKELAVMIYGG